MAKQSVLASAATSATYNMMLQLTFRILTFILNAFILRYISKDMLGIVNVRLMLLYSTTLFVAREAFRKACLSKTSTYSWQQVINLLWCTVPISVVCTALLSYLWCEWLEVPDPDLMPHYRLAVMSYAVSTVLVMLAEPVLVVSQALLFVRLRVIIEGISLASQCVTTVIQIYLYPQWGLINFCIAQVLFGVVYTVLHYGYFTWYIGKTSPSEEFPFRTITDLFPKRQPGKPWTDWGLAALTWSFFKQGFLKQLLTEGEKYVMTIFGVLSFADQGVYDVISNLGSLAARFIFLPLEDSSYLFFSQSLHRGVSAKAQEKNESLKLATTVLKTLLKLTFLIGLTFLVFGFAYSYLLLDIYGGSVLSSRSGPSLLRWYCLYVLVIAVNGITEGFVFAAMSKEDVDRYNKKMLIFSFLFLSFSWFLTRTIGSKGFILANCLNMGLRITHSVYYILNFYDGTPYSPLKGLLLSPVVTVSYVGAFIITASSETFLCCSQGLLQRILHIGVGGICLLAVMATVYMSEGETVAFIKEQYWNRHKTKSKSETKHE